MGQLLGRAKVHESAQLFVNLDQTAIYRLWEGFNDIAEGFGINSAEAIEIISIVSKTNFVGIPKNKLEYCIEKLFQSLDTDKNNLVDALEMLVTLCMLSSVELRDKAKFCFMCFDFDESEKITLDELTLLFKSCVTGLCKLCNQVSIPEESTLEKMAKHAFLNTSKGSGNKISVSEFIEYCLNTPEIVSWFNCFDESEDISELTDVTVGLIENMSRQNQINAFQVSVPLADVVCEEGQTSERAKNIIRAAWDPSMSARLPWRDTIVFIEPSNVTKPPVGIPDKNALQLEWVHGFNSQSCRNSARYTMNGDIVYPAASVGVVYSPATHTQRFHLGHVDQIQAVAIHPNGIYVATGDVGAPASVLIWHAETGELITSIRGYHQHGVSMLAFSPEADSKWLLTVGNDPLHSVAVYDWTTNELAFAHTTSRLPVLHALFRWPSKTVRAGTAPSFVTCGEDHISFWNQENNRRCKKGIFGTLGPRQTMLALACHASSNRIVSGALSGHLYLWNAQRSLLRTVHAHESAVTALEFQQDKLLSGSHDGKIRVWTANLDQVAVFDIAGASLIPAIVGLSALGNRLLVSTRASEMFELDIQNGSNLHEGPLLSGHCSMGGLYGLSVHPERGEFATVGDDGTLRIWDVETKRMRRMRVLDGASRSVAYSPDGTMLVVGIGGGAEASSANKKPCKKEGAYVVLNESDLRVVHEARDSKMWISDIKFCPNGSTLAVASADTFIYSYNVEDFASKGKCKGHHGGILNMDFSDDNQCIQSQCDTGELLFWNAHTGEPYQQPSTMKDVDWNTVNVPVQWSVQSAWDSPDAAPIVICEKARKSDVLVSGDAFGRLRMYQFPMVDSQQQFSEYAAHTGPVRRTQFIFNDKHLISIGSQDRCIMQWKHVADDSIETDASEQDTGEIQYADSEDEIDLARGEVVKNLYIYDQSIPATALSKASATQAASQPPSSVAADDGAVIDVPEKAWVRAAIPPTTPPAENKNEPDESLALEWVHGYNAQTSRGSVRYLASGEIVYPAASLGVIHSNHSGGVQRYFSGHAGIISALAVHPNGKYVATGDISDTPCVQVWNTENMEAIATLRGVFRDGIASVKFSKCGTKVVAVGMDRTHMVAVFHWQDGDLMLQGMTGTRKVLDIDFRPDGLGLVQCGVKHIKFHSLHDKNIVTQNAILGKKGELQVMCAIGWTGNDVVVGTADGHLYGFEGRTLKRSIQGHTRSVVTICSGNDILVTGGKDGRVRVWNMSLEMKSEFDITNGLHSVRSVCLDQDETKIVIGLRDCRILEIATSDGTIMNEEGPITSGHSKHELWGLAMHPTKNEYCTVGDDQTVRVWDIGTRRLIKSKTLDTMARACVYSPDGRRIAVGLGGKVGAGRQKKDGSLLIFEEADFTLIHEVRNAKQWITELKYSADGATLAVGSYDNAVYLYDVAGGYNLKGVFKENTSPIMHIDFSSDGQYVQTNATAHDLRYAESNNGAGIRTPSTLRDTAWATLTCPLNWSVKGFQSADVNGPEISAMDRNQNGTLVMGADSRGLISVRRYPALSTLGGSKTYRCHSGIVRSIRISSSGTHSISVGGRDRCIMQWKLLEAENDDAIRAGDSGSDSDVTLENKALGKQVTEKDEEPGGPRPWLRSIVPPTGAPSATTQGDGSPSIVFELEHIYGHRSQDVRSHVQYNELGQLCYFGASMGIIYDKAEHKQQFYGGHAGNPIVSLAMHPSGKYVATGEGSSELDPTKPAEIHIWNALTGLGIFKIKVDDQVAVSKLSFSPCGNRLVSVGENENHTVCVWRSDSGYWDDTALQAQSPGGLDKVLSATFLNSTVFVTTGTNNVQFWNVQGGRVYARKGVFGRKGKIQPILCTAALQQDADAAMPRVVTGTVSGHMYVWSNYECVRTVKAHERTINSIHSCAAGVVTGSRDGVVKLWDPLLTPIKALDFTNVSPVAHRPCIRSVCWDPIRGVVAVGTQGSEIYEYSTGNESMTQLLTGHAMHQLHGLACNPKDPSIVITAGDDHTIRVWDISRRVVIAEKMIGYKTRCACFSPCGKVVTIGMGAKNSMEDVNRDGGVMVLSASTLELLHEIRDSREAVLTCKYSPDGETLAVSSYDNKIYLYDVRKNYELRAKCTEASNPVKHIDFSTDSSYLRCNCTGSDLIFFKAENGAHIEVPSIVKDIPWETANCTMAWNVQGMWPEYVTPTQHNACDGVTSHGGVLVSGDQYGHLNLFHFPCISMGSKPVQFIGHCGTITNVRFNADCSKVLTTGGQDRVMCQWKVCLKEE